MVPPPGQYTVGVYNQITLLILYYINPRLVTLLKVSDATVQVTDILGLTVSFKVMNFSFQIFLLVVPEMSTSFTFYIVLIVYIVWFGSCNHCILACSLWSKNYEHSSSSYGLCCFDSYRHRLTSVEVL